MSQMPRQATLPTCPSCAEPLDAGDRFCGACGCDLSAAAARHDDHPTLTMNGDPPTPAGPAAPDSHARPSAAPGGPGSGAPAPGSQASGPVAPGAGFRGTPLPGYDGTGTSVPGMRTGRVALPAAEAHGAPAWGPGFGGAAAAGTDFGGTPAPGAAGAGSTRLPAPDATSTPGEPVPGSGFGGTTPPGTDPSGTAGAGHGFGGGPAHGTDSGGGAGASHGFGGGPAHGTDAHGGSAPGSGFGGEPTPGTGAGGVPVSPTAAAHVPSGGSEPSGEGPVPPGVPGPAGSPVPPASPAEPGSGVRFDRPAEPEEYPLQAPDPRVAAEAAAVAGSGKVCVACRAGRVDDDGYCENCGHAQPRERDHMEQEAGPVAAVSDRGLRHHRNEDAFGVGHTALPDGSPALVAIVCDGVSSATRPDDASLAASRAASRSLLTALPQGTHPQQAMHDAIVAASHAVNALAEEPATAREHAPHQNAPACTLVGAVVTAGLLVVGWVGDSRVYWVPTDRASAPARLTEDDSWAAQMVAAGLMNEAEAYADDRAHAITGWLGADAYELEPHTASFKPDRPGVLVVCTDGLWNYAEAAEDMAGAVPLDAAVRPLHAARVLVGHALDGGGHDNVTVAVLPFPAPSQGAGSA